MPITPIVSLIVVLLWTTALCAVGMRLLPRFQGTIEAAENEAGSEMLNVAMCLLALILGIVLYAGISQSFLLGDAARAILAAILTFIYVAWCSTITSNTLSAYMLRAYSWRWLIATLGTILLPVVASAAIF